LHRDSIRSELAAEIMKFVFANITTHTVAPSERLTSG
jgi:hypothetical protein